MKREASRTLPLMTMITQNTTLSILSPTAFKLAVKPALTKPCFKWKTQIGEFDDLNALDWLLRNLEVNKARVTMSM